jgi:hypothetical protein
VDQCDGTSIWQVGVNNEVVAENELLRRIMLDQDIVVTEFKRKKYELEEVFMQIVKGDGDDC